MARWDVGAEVAGKASGILPQTLLTLAQSPEIRALAQASTEEFLKWQLSQRPAFVLESSLGDKAVFSGLVQLAPLSVTIDAMLEDIAGYDSHRAHFRNNSAS